MDKDIFEEMNKLFPAIVMPEGMSYAAIDADGFRFFYQYEPNAMERDGLWDSGLGKTLIDSSFIPNEEQQKWALENWSISLVYCHRCENIDRKFSS